MGDSDVDLQNRLLDTYSGISSLVTYGRAIESSRENKTLAKLARAHGWRVFNRFIQVNDTNVAMFGDRYNGAYYFTYALFPWDEDGRRTFSFPTYSTRRSLGDILFKAAWGEEEKRIGHRPYRLSPRVVDYDKKNRIVAGRRRVEVRTKLAFQYIDPLFYPLLKGPVDLSVLDKTISTRAIRLNTASVNGGRGDTVEELLSHLRQYFRAVKIEAHRALKPQLVRINVSSKLLTDMLNAICEQVGGLWEWVDGDEIKLVPGSLFKGTLPPTLKF